MTTPQLSGLDHVNIRTNRLQELIGFYRRVLGLETGPRPDFSMAGSWLYLGTQPIVHLVATTEPLNNERVQIEHFALKGVDLDATVAHLDREGVAREIRCVPGYDMMQIFIRDPDGNHIEINFDIPTSEHR